MRGQDGLCPARYIYIISTNEIRIAVSFQFALVGNDLLGRHLYERIGDIDSIGGHVDFLGSMFAYSGINTLANSSGAVSTGLEKLSDPEDRYRWAIV